MGIVKGILIAIYLVIALVLIVLTLIQTKEGKQKKWTVILSVVFVVLTIALGIVYMA